MSKCLLVSPTLDFKRGEHQLNVQVARKNVLTDFLTLRCVVRGKRSVYGNLKYKQLSLRATLGG